MLKQSKSSLHLLLFSANHPLSSSIVRAERQERDGEPRESFTFSLINSKLHSQNPSFTSTSSFLATPAERQERGRELWTVGENEKRGKEASSSSLQSTPRSSSKTTQAITSITPHFLEQTESLKEGDEENKKGCWVEAGRLKLGQRRGGWLLPFSIEARKPTKGALGSKKHLGSWLSLDIGTFLGNFELRFDCLKGDENPEA